MSIEIKNVVFDFGGVLFDWDPRYFYRSVFNNDEKMEFFLKNITTTTWNSQMDRGRTFEECMNELANEHPEYKEQIMLYRKGWDTMLKGEIENGIRLFNAVKKSGKYKIYGLTNWSAETFPVAFNRFKCLQEFEGIVVSGEEKMIKPEKGIYLTLLERYGLKPEETFFTDDNLANIEVAKSRGIHTIQFLNNEENLKEIASFLKIEL